MDLRCSTIVGPKIIICWTQVGGKRAQLDGSC